ncbi:MAG: GNAT family N-acetyltransferase [Syntrophales bacterium]|nr:GNAT family N-acetyltransferase [Syntrophales bacterium]
MADQPLTFVEMTQKHIPDAVELIRRSMNEDEARWARRSFDFHFFCMTHGHSDGRRYFLALKEERLIGMTGWHHYEWGPDDALWGGWTAVDPASQGSFAALFLIANTALEMLRAGYRKVFVETYSSDEFDRARRFYEEMGCRVAGHIESYLRPSVDMVVYVAILAELEWDSFRRVLSEDRFEEYKRLARQASSIG